jgi:hypothetical protein
MARLGVFFELKFVAFVDGFKNYEFLNFRASSF